MNPRACNSIALRYKVMKAGPQPSVDRLFGNSFLWLSVGGQKPWRKSGFFQFLSFTSVAPFAVKSFALDCQMIRSSDAPILNADLRLLECYYCCYHQKEVLSLQMRPRRLARPRTSPFHGGNTGSNPVGDAKLFQGSFCTRRCYLGFLCDGIAGIVKTESAMGKLIWIFLR